MHCPAHASYFHRSCHTQWPAARSAAVGSDWPLLRKRTQPLSTLATHALPHSTRISSLHRTQPVTAVTQAAGRRSRERQAILCRAAQPSDVPLQPTAARPPVWIGLLSLLPVFLFSAAWCLSVGLGVHGAYNCLWACTYLAAIAWQDIVPHGAQLAGSVDFTDMALTSVNAQALHFDPLRILHAPPHQHTGGLPWELDARIIRTLLPVAHQGWQSCKAVAMSKWTLPILAISQLSLISSSVVFLAVHTPAGPIAAALYVLLTKIAAFCRAQVTRLRARFSSKSSGDGGSGEASVSDSQSSEKDSSIRSSSASLPGRDNTAASERLLQISGSLSLVAVSTYIAATETGVPAMVKGQWAADPSTILFVLSSVVGDVLLPIVVVCGVALAAVVGLWQSRGDSSRDVSSSTSSINESRRGGGSNDSSTDDPSTSESCTQSPGFGWVQRGLQLVLCVRSLIDAALTLAVATGGLAGQVSAVRIVALLLLLRMAWAPTLKRLLQRGRIKKSG